MKKPPQKPTKKSISAMTVRELETAVRYHNYLYFEKHAPEISDYKFDRLTRRLAELKPDAAVLSEIPIEGAERAKIRHTEAMLSLEKAYEATDVLKWAAKFDGPLLVSPKIDGLAVEIRYDKQGQLNLAATRGDGFQGDEITQNIRMVRDVPTQLPQGDVAVRGEVYLRLSVFKKRYEGQFANPRNLAAGALKQKDSQKTGEYQLSFFAYGLLGTADQTEWERFAQLKAWKIPTVETKRVERDEIGKIYEYFVGRRERYDFETDGVVYRADRIVEQERLGATAHHPRWSIAYKYQGDSGVTTLKDVEWSVARSRVITPIGLVEPVALSGAMVSRVSLHNYGLMKEKGLRQGAKVIMVRRGGVIPYLEAVQAAGKGKVFRAPKKCPSCGSPTEVKDEFLYCTNLKGCTQTRIAELEHFIKTVGIDGFGPKLVSKLYDDELVTEPADFYDLTKEALMKLERMGEKLATKLIRNVQDKRRLDRATFLAALGIREVGTQSAKLLAENYSALPRKSSMYQELGKLFGAEKEPSKYLGEHIEELKKWFISIDTIGPIIADELMKGLEDKNILIKRLLERVEIVPHAGGSTVGPLRGKKFCFTGEMAAMKRSAAQKRVTALGGMATNSVTKDLDYLVVGSEGGAGSKLTKAEKLVDAGGGLKILQEKEFLEMIQ